MGRCDVTRLRGSLCETGRKMRCHMPPAVIATPPAVIVDSARRSRRAWAVLQQTQVWSCCSFVMSRDCTIRSGAWRGARGIGAAYLTKSSRSSRLSSAERFTSNTMRETTAL